MKANSILAKASAIMRSAEANYRDSLLKVGRLLHEFLLEYLREGDKFSYSERKAAGARTRESGILSASKHLGIPKKRIHTLITIAMAVDLLSNNGDIGCLKWYCLPPFTRFIQRIGKNLSKVTRETAEHWIIKPGFEKTAVALFRKAALEGIARKSPEFKRAGKLMVRGEKARKLKRQINKEQEFIDSVRKMAKIKKPYAFAELLFQAINDSSDPYTVSDHLWTLVREKIAA